MRKYQPFLLFSHEDQGELRSICVPRKGKDNIPHCMDRTLTELLKSFINFRTNSTRAAR